jgi:hypothetical protein
MRLYFLFLVVVSMLLAACSPQVKPISPPPYPPPGTPVTPATATGSVKGRISLQGRINHAGVTVTVGELAPAVTKPDGSYEVTGIISLGQYVVAATMPGYLGAQGHSEIAAVGETKNLPTVTLLAGDLNGDGAVNLFDLVLLCSAFGKVDAAGQSSDLNADGAVNLFDLVLVGNNLDRKGPIPLE